MGIALTERTLVMGEDGVTQRKSAKALSPKQMDDLFSTYADGKKGTDKAPDSKMKMKEVQDKAPTYVFIGLVVAVVRLTIGGTFHEEPSEEQSHYSTLGIKRMCKAEEISVGYEKAKKELSGDALADVEEAYKTLSNPRLRRTYDRATPASREDLYYKALKYIGKNDGLSWQAVSSGKTSYMVEVHSGSARISRHASIHSLPPNWARLMTKTSKILRNNIQLGRINIDAEPELAEELGLTASNTPKLPYMLAVTGPEPTICGLPSDSRIGVNGGCRAYKGEARILKLADFVGEGIPMGPVEPVTYATVDKWKKSSPNLVKVLLFRKSFTAMVLAFREAAEELDGYGFKFGEVDVRSRGTVNLWRRFNLRRLPLVAVLRDDGGEAAMYGGQLTTKTLENWLMINKNPWLPRVTSENFEDKCINGGKRFCAILAVDATGVAYRRINQTLDVFIRAKKLVEQHPRAKDVEFVWADRIAEHLNSTTDSWKSLTTVFQIENAERKSENLLMLDNKAYTFKNFGGDLNKVTDFSDKDEDMRDFVVSMLDEKAGKVKPLPSPLFSPPPPPPYTQEDITKLFVLSLVCIAVLGGLAWSYITFKKEEAIKDSIEKASGKKKKKEKRDGEYSLGDD